MRVLKLRTVHLDDRPRIAKQNLRCRFHDARLARTGRAQKQQIAHRTPRRVQPRAKYLVQIHQRLHALFLPYHLRPQRGLKLQRVRAAFFRIQRANLRAHDGLLASRGSSDATPKPPRPGLNCCNLTWIVECNSCSCTSNSLATAGDSEICSTGGSRSARSRCSERRLAISFWTSGDCGSARFTCRLNCSRSAGQLSSTNGCFFETSRT